MPVVTGIEKMLCELSQPAASCVDLAVTPRKPERVDDAAVEHTTRADALALMERLRTGDAAAFDRLYALYRARVHAFLLRLSGSAVLARDLSQEVWLRFAVNARRLAAGTEPAA